MIREIFALLPTRKPCGCKKPKHDGPFSEAMECTLNEKFKVYENMDQIVCRSKCTSCGGTYIFKLDTVGVMDDSDKWYDSWFSYDEIREMFPSYIRADITYEFWDGGSDE